MRRDRWLAVSLVLPLSTNACCSRDLGRDVTSPDGRFVARESLVDCGATVAFYEEVTLRRVGASSWAPSWAGGEEAVLRFRGTSVDKIQWLGPRELLIEASLPYGATKMLGDWRGVMIKYSNPATQPVRP